MKKDTTRNQNFIKSYKNLNNRQREAVDAIDGPVMVIAGPGTGKTTILTLRIANILEKTDTPPDSILALTFTESGVTAMRRKLLDLIGPTAYRVSIATFHSFCNDIIKNYPEYFPRIIGSEAITDIDQVEIIERILTDQKNNFDLLLPAGDMLYYVRKVLGEIRNLKRESISYEDFMKSLKDDEKSIKNSDDLYHTKGAYKGKMKAEYIKQLEHLEKNKELAEAYKKYEEILFKEKKYDFEDMIIEVIKVLSKSKENLLLILQEQYQYILADEHQDANLAQNKLLQLLSNFHDNPNLFIVGDDKQAIFRFQGASLENFLFFKRLYPKARLIKLDTNYRSTPRILDTAHSLIENNVNRSDADLVRLKSVGRSESGSIQEHSIFLTEYQAESDESFGVADKIKDLISKGTNPDEIAVLYRKRNDAIDVAKALSGLNVPFFIESDRDIFSSIDIQTIIKVFRVINNLSDDEILAECLLMPIFDLPRLDSYKIINHYHKDRRRESGSLFEAIKDKNTKEVFKDFAKNLELWSRQASSSENFLDLFEKILKEMKMVEHILASKNLRERLNFLEAFYNHIKNIVGSKRHYTLSDFIKYIDSLKNHDILVNFSIKPFEKSVRLMTAHKSKGLEFEHVFIIKTIDGNWSNSHKKRNFHIPILTKMGGIDEESLAIDDERRLFYVAITRAKEAVHISYFLKKADGKEAIPSQFISEIDPKLLCKERSDMHQNPLLVNVTTSTTGGISAGPITAEAAAAYTTYTGFGFEEKYLRDLFLEQGMTVTALNNFLKCPWQYFFINLIRIPKLPERSQRYGSAIHATLKTFFDKYRQDENMSIEQVLAIFQKRLSEQPFSKIEYKESLKKGQEVLKEYLKYYKGTWPKNIINEYSMSGINITIDMEDTDLHLPDQTITLPLKGNIDRVDILPSGKIHVVDYKTGKVKTRNEILGKTKDADGNYFRQLAFYKLLISKDKRFQTGHLQAGHDDLSTMETGEIDFIETDKNGNHHKEIFTIESEDMKKVNDEIAMAARSIYNLSFIKNKERCSDQDCKYCDMADILPDYTKSDFL